MRACSSSARRSVRPRPDQGLAARCRSRCGSVRSAVLSVSTGPARPVLRRDFSAMLRAAFDTFIFRGRYFPYSRGRGNGGISAAGASSDLSGDRSEGRERARPRGIRPHVAAARSGASAWGAGMTRTITRGPSPAGRSTGRAAPDHHLTAMSAALRLLRLVSPCSAKRQLSVATATHSWRFSQGATQSGRRIRCRRNWRRRTGGVFRSGRRCAAAEVAGLHSGRPPRTRPLQAPRPRARCRA